MNADSPDVPGFSALFNEEPFRWGLRGDPWLWREMAERLRGDPRPRTAEELADRIEAAFRDLTGASVSSEEPFFVERYSHGGMSSGYVSPEFWRETAIPLLRDRFLEGRNPDS